MAEKIEITFLGTGSAVPTKRRNHSGILLKFKEQNFLFDCGEGIQKQFRIADINPCKITKIFITHWHGDHFLGLAGLFQTLETNSCSHVIEVYGGKNIKKNIFDLLSLVNKTYLLDKKRDSDFRIEVKEIEEGIVVDDDEWEISCKKTFHTVESYAFSFNIKEKNRIDKEKLKKLNIGNSPIVAELVKGKTIDFNGKKIDGKKLIYKEEPKKICIILDTKYSPKLIDFAKKSDILICESTYQSNQQELADEYCHLTTTNAAEIAKQSESKQLFMTHISQKNSEIPKILKHQAITIFKNSIVAEDFDKVEL